MEKQPYQKEYMRRIHVTQDYIEKHIGEPMSLEEIAQVASERYQNSAGIVVRKGGCVIRW